MSRRILISGASIAGNTAALALGRRGFEVTVIERADAFRDGGQNIDVRGVGRDVLRRLGLEAAALQHGTGEEGTAWINEDGEVAAQFNTSETGDDGPTAEMEILRGDLARLLYDAARDVATFRFGEQIEAVSPASAGEADGSGHAGTGVDVRFKSGQSDHFDAVLIAEGVGSSTRELVFPGQNDPRWMDLTMAYFTIPRIASDDRLWRWYHAPEGRSISLRPDQHGTTRAMLCLQQAPKGEQDWSVEQQKRYLHERFADAGWQAERVLAGMEATDDFYFDVLRQVRLPRWHQDAVALVGDAAWCATPLAGIGATLAVTGGYVLAGELARAEAVPAALAAYEAAMRPMVEQGQDVPKIGPRLMNPHTRLGIHLLHGALKVASQPPLVSLAQKLFSKPPKAPDLSRYD